MTYTVTIPSEAAHNPGVLTWKDLNAIQFNFNAPFQLQLNQHDVFFAESVARLIPKRRLVAYGRWQGKSVVAKLFFDAQHAKRHIEKDVAGVKLLQENKIPTPAIYHQCQSADKRIHVLILERIVNADNLETIWQTKKNPDDLLIELQAVIIELATQHVLGVLQHDMHLKNFLITEKTIYTLDGGQVELFPQLLSKKLSMNNLALFLSQLGVGIEAFQIKLFKHYAKARGWIIKESDIGELFLIIKHWDELRWKRFEKKIFRESTDFACIREMRAYGMYNRAAAGPDMLDFLKNPEAAFHHPNMIMLKDGRSTTVIKLTLDNREYVIKRYNIKHIWHRLRRCLRPTRAMKSWRLAQKLTLFRVRTAKPIAFIERRLLGLRSRSYYVTEYVSGEHAGEFFLRHTADEVTTRMVKNITDLLKSIAKLKITHGDLKATNILIDNDHYPVLIDLDGALEHASFSSLGNAWRKEIKRLLDNFHDQPIICEKFKTEFKNKDS